MDAILDRRDFLWEGTRVSARFLQTVKAPVDDMGKTRDHETASRRWMDLLEAVSVVRGVRSRLS